MNFKMEDSPEKHFSMDIYKEHVAIKNEQASVSYAVENHFLLGDDKNQNESTSSQKKIYDCEFCEYKSLKKNDILKHVSSVHLKNKSSCPECGKILANVAEHVKFFHRKERRFQCEECKYRSCFRNDLKKHVNSVHRKLKQPCPECGKEIVNVAEHVRLIHTKPTQFKCQLCKYIAYKKQDLKKHVDAVHKKYMECVAV